MATIELETLRTEPLSDEIASIVLDLPKSSANILNAALFRDFEKALDEVENDSAIKGVVIRSAKPKIFIAGADLVAIANAPDWNDQQIIDFCDHGQKLFHRMMCSDTVFVAAIHGVCVGGGFELTLGCHARVASKHKRTWLGLPETKLGLIPGWAGTVRLPRLVGVEKAAQLICGSQNISCEDAIELGLIDRLVEEDDLINESMQLINELNDPAKLEAIRARHTGPAQLEADHASESYEKIKSEILASTEIHPTTPLALAEHIYSSRNSSFEDACLSEGQTMARVWRSESARGLINYFFLNEHNKKRPGFVDLKTEYQPVQKIGLLGAGLMGSAIAKCFVERGFPIRVFDVNEHQLAVTDQQVAKFVNGNPDSYRSGNSLDVLGDCDFIVESIVENTTVKKQMFERLEEIISPSAVIGTNTSTIPIDHLANDLKHPERFCGFHFSNPVDRMPIIEVIRSSQSKDQHIASLTSFAKSIGKIPVAIKDSPGFVVNRMLSSILSGAVDLLHEQWQTQEVDQIIREFGFRLGPFEIVDLIGVDTVYYAARVMYDQGMRCITLSPILPAIFKLNRLGRKSLAGIYKYRSEEAAAESDPVVEELIKKYYRTDRTNYRADDVVKRILFPAISDAAELIERGIVKDARDIDVCIIHGLSFPTYRGGLLFWADQLGIDHIVKSLESFGSKRTEPSAALRQMAEESRHFYG